MDPKRLFWFVITSSVVLVLIDVYVIASWQRFVRNMRWSPWLSRIAWTLALSMAVLSPYVNFVRSNQSQLENWQFVVFISTTIWYVPKIPIMLFLVIKDCIRLIAAFFRMMARVFSKQQPANELSKLKNSEIVTNTSAELQNHKSESNGSISPLTASAAKSVVVPLEGRRKVLQATAWSMAAIPFYMVSKGVDTTDEITVYRQDIDLPHLASAFEGIRIAQISDIHAGSWRDSKAFQETRRLIDLEKPDILVITGDFVNFQPDELRVIRTELEKLHADMGVFASLGNHDHYMRPAEHELLKSVIRNCGMTLLVNESHSFQVNSDKLQLVAIDNTGLGQNYGDLSTAMIGVSDAHPTILLAHDPTFWDKEVRGKRPIDLMLSGHTHGGQVGMKILGQELSVAQFVYKQWAGLYKDNSTEQQLYVNRGLGTIGPPMRIGVPPEISLFTLRQRRPLLG